MLHDVVIEASACVHMPNIDTPLTPRPIESHSGPGKPLLQGPITTSFRMCRDQDAEGVKREETWGGVFPHHPTRGLGEHCKLRAPRAPAENGCYAYLKSERSHLETLFSISERWRAPKRHGARENFPASPLSTVLPTPTFDSIVELSALCTRSRRV